MRYLLTYWSTGETLRVTYENWMMLHAVCPLAPVKGSSVRVSDAGYITVHKEGTK